MRELKNILPSTHFTVGEVGAVGCVDVILILFLFREKEAFTSHEYKNMHTKDNTMSTSRDECEYMSVLNVKHCQWQ